MTYDPMLTKEMGILDWSRPQLPGAWCSASTA